MNQRQKIESLIERNMRLRSMIIELTKDNKRLREIDRAWSACCESLRQQIRDIKFEQHLARVRQKPWWKRLFKKRQTYTVT